MTSPSRIPHVFKWRSLNRNGEKVQTEISDIDQWRKRVEQASEFAVSEVLYPKKHYSGSSARNVPLQHSEQLRDHDEAYKEAQALVGDWLSSNLQMEAEMDEVDDIMSSVRRKRPALNFSHLTAPSYDNFEDLYNCLAEEDMHITVNNVLQDLMEQDLLDTGMMEELALDVGKTKKKIRDPLITMEARHQLVRENRAQRDTERQKQQREREALRAAREEVKRRELEEEKRRNQDAHREEEMVQQEMVRLRRQMEEQKRLKQLVRQRERQRTGQRSEGDLQSTPTPTPSPQQQQVTKRQHRKQKIQSIVQMNNLKCLHRHFSGWYSVVLDQRLRMGKATALSNWKRQLRAWRVWRLHVWAEQKHKEVLRIKEELQTECRQEPKEGQSP